MYRLTFLMLAGAIWLGAAPVTFTYSGYLTEGKLATSPPQFMVLSFTFESTATPDSAIANHAVYPVLSFAGTMGGTAYGGGECQAPGYVCSSSLAISNNQESSGTFADEFHASFLVEVSFVKRSYDLLLRTVSTTTPSSLATTALPLTPPDPSAFAEATLTFGLDGFFPLETAMGSASPGANPTPEPSTLGIAAFSALVLAIGAHRRSRSRA